MQKCVLSIIALSVSFEIEDYKYHCSLLQHISKSRRSLDIGNVTSSILQRIAHVYSEQGHWDKAEELQVEVMKKRKQVLGDNHPDTLTSMANLATTYWNQGHWKEAEGLQVEVVEKRKQVLGEDHPHTLQSMENLAVMYHTTGCRVEAEGLDAVVKKAKKQHNQ
ncbi:hypothetical protein BDN70DRAFT_816206 [Pholiota conissans]|uniref:Kinesin light chain n=1 Tax=Pholiota conissans TaxID=109636 RepID=A0A9P6CP26_9AGAR|nr:hypothetical protein BDN70DRAFT_816206 [Pholiota conissans]